MDRAPAVKTKRAGWFRLSTPTPLGPVVITWRKDHRRDCIVTAIHLPGEERMPPKDMEGPLGALPQPVALLVDWLGRFFPGEATAPPLQVLDLEQLYRFQKTVLLCLAQDIPRGMTVSYGALARRVGAPGAARAVGTAMARNPFPLILPCHRVIRASGDPGGFGGGVHMKKALLVNEGVLFGEDGTVSPSCRAKGS